MLKQISPVSGLGIHLKHVFQNMAMYERHFLENIVIMKKHQVKLKQKWIAEIGLIVLTTQLKKDSDEKMYSSE